MTEIPDPVIFLATGGVPWYCTMITCSVHNEYWSTTIHLLSYAYYQYSTGIFQYEYPVVNVHRFYVQAVLHHTDRSVVVAELQVL